MALFGSKEKHNEGGLLGDMIQSSETDRNWLIYKWRPAGEEAGGTKRENSIRLGSSLVVRQGEVAVFQYAGKEAGGKQDYIEGYFSDTLKTSNLPILARIMGAFLGGGSKFPAQVYFINTAGINQVPFGVPYFSMFDPRLPDHNVDVSVRGTITFRIADYKLFASLYSLSDFDMSQFQQKIRNSVIDHTQNSMMDIQAKLGRPLIQINTYRREIRDILQSDLSPVLLSAFGVTLTEFNLTAIEIDQSGNGYQQLAKLTKNITQAKIEQEADLSLRGMQDQYEMNKKNLEATAAINLENMQDGMRRSREESQYAQHMQSEMSGFALYQLKQQEEIAKAAAGAMGQMGQNAGVTMGGSGPGLNPGAMMAGMAMGQQVGQGMAGMMGNIFNQMGQQMPGGSIPPPMPGAAVPPSMPGAPPPMPGTPPPAPGVSPPVSQFNIAVNGQTFGPYDINTLAQMAGAGQFNAQSMVWRQGMAGWQAAGTVPELAGLFTSAGTPPPPPAS